MQIIELDDFKDSRLSLYWGVSEPALLRSHGCFIAEGRTVVERVIARAPQSVRSLLVNRAACRALEESLESHGVSAPTFVCDTDAFLQLTGHRFHRGCLALVDRPDAVPWRRIVRGARLLVVLDGVGNPDNVGSVFRSAAALGAGGILLGPGTADPLYRKAIRTSMGAVFQVPYAQLGDRDEDYPQALGELGRLGVKRLALSLNNPSVELRKWAGSQPLRGSQEFRPLALLVGAEGPGLGEVSEKAADVRLQIEMSAGVDSLNLGVATAIALHQLRAVT